MMDLCVRHLEGYLRNGSMPGIYSPFFEDCKELYDENQQKFNDMLDRLGTCEIDKIRLIINIVILQYSSERMLFAVYAKHRGGGTIGISDIPKVLPTIGFGK